MHAQQYMDPMRIETAPIIASFLPVKDIADEVKAKLSADMANKTPPELKQATDTAVADCANYLSQPIALRSGAAGDRYPLNFLSAIMKSLGSRPLFEFKGFGMTYEDAGDALKVAGPLESDPKAEQLANEIYAEMKRGITDRLAPTVAGSLESTGVINDAAKHLAKTGMAKGNALEHLTDLMKEKGQVPLATLQGYEQTYDDAARRLNDAPSLAADKVEKGAYENVSAKLHALYQEKPSDEHHEHMPGIIEDSSKFLSSPIPDNKADKRKVLGDLMSRNGSAQFDKEKMYKVTYDEAGKEIQNAPTGVTTARDPQKAAANEGKINSVIPNKKLQELLKPEVKEGAAHLADAVDGRGEAMQEIHDAMKKEGSKEFLTAGQFSTTHEGAAGMIADTNHFEGLNPNPVLKEKVAEKIGALDTAGSPIAKQYMEDASNLASDYIAGVATKEGGLDDKGLAASGPMSKGPAKAGGTTAGAPDGAAAGAGARAAGAGATGGARAGSIDNPSETEEQRRKRLGLPLETDQERSNRLETERQKKPGLPPETEEERSNRLETERRRKLGLSPETDVERADRLEAERRKRLGLPPETDEERGTRLEAERRRRLGLPPETEEERLGRQKLERERRKAGPGGDDPDREAAMGILHSQLRSKGKEILYKQPQTELTHSGASDWLKMKPPAKVDKTVKESGDASRLSKKFERKLSNLVAKATPPPMQDSMQDVVIESARNLAEVFVTKNYKTLVKEGLIAEMQKKGNEILIDVNGDTETCFFAAQRLKKAKSYEAKEPCDQVAYYISKKLDEIIRGRTMPRKLTGIMKEHTKEAADYLSGLVTKSDSDIEAYVALLGEMEVTGDALLIEGDIPKSYKDCAAYLRSLTAYEDQINRSDYSLQSAIESKLKNIMANVPPRGYLKSHMSSAITYATKLLVSYIKLQEEKTKALKFLIDRLKEGGSGVLLRHGVIRKSYADGAELLNGKNADQLNVTSDEPVVARKIQIKLLKLMHDGTTIPAKYQDLIDDLIEDTTLYLAVNLLQPRVIQVCKCMKNVFVQCELWCDEILRRVARPCCTCSRHVSAAALADLAPESQRLRILPGHTRAIAPGIEISLTTCPSHRSRSRSRNDNRTYSPCPANITTPDCPGNRNYDVLYATCEHYRFGSASPPRLDQPDYQPTTSTNYSDLNFTTYSDIPTSSKTAHLTTMKSLVFDINTQNQIKAEEEKKIPAFSSLSSGSSPSYHTPNSVTGQSDTKSTPHWQMPTPPMLPKIQTYERSHTHIHTRAQARTPIVSTDQMADWHAMMVSLMWNVQAWREWIQENIDRALSYHQETEIEQDTGLSICEAEENWVVFQRRVATEALQWRQYNIFSRQLTLRLAMRYRDKQIVSPTRATNQTGSYMKCQEEMLEIIEMFNRWTQWLTAVVQETNSVTQTPGNTESMDEVRWKYFKNKVMEYLEDWMKYKNHLKVCWENKYKTLMADWLPAWRNPGPVWVVSACGAVPSGAVSGGLYDGEMIWVARTTHRCNVLPAALHPSKHCCIVYADGGVHHYTKYQVMCNAEVHWRAWRAGALGACAVRVAPGTHVGRVHYRGSHLIGAVYTPNYRCHVVIFGRPFAFNCYELLVLKEDETAT